MKMSKAMTVRVAAVKAASSALQNDRFGTVDVWALAVFYEQYIWEGGDGTRKQFGPKKPKKAKILRLVKS